MKIFANKKILNIHSHLYILYCKTQFKMLRRKKGERVCVCERERERQRVCACGRERKSVRYKIYAQKMAQCLLKKLF